MSKQRCFGAAVALALGLLISVSVPARVGADNGPQTDRELRDAVTVDGILEHEEALQAIADDNDDTRASGTPGYEASVDYVVDRLEDAGYHPQVQSFLFPFFQQLAPSTFAEVSPTMQTFVEGTDYFLADFSGSGDVTELLQPTNDLVLPPGPDPSTSNAGCEPEDFSEFDAGNIALIQRGTCFFEDKVANAIDAGAVGVVLFNEGQPGRTDAQGVTLGRPFDIPVVFASFAVGDALATEAAAGDVTIHLVTSTQSEERETWNVLADAQGGNRHRTVVVGAHLDSVLAGPGINDNGSGSATILELAEQWADVHGERNRVRFAWWGAEESGLLGSEHYVSTLTPTQLDDIALNLNYDMLASPNFVRFVYDGDGSDTGTAGPAGSDRIEQAFLDYFERQGLATEPTAFDGRSDYGPFIAVGIPAGGLFSGAEGIKTPEQEAVYGGTAGVAYDHCYHQACDTIDNVNTEVLDQFGDGVAFAAWRWAHAQNVPTGGGGESTSAAASVSPTHVGHAVVA